MRWPGAIRVGGAASATGSASAAIDTSATHAPAALPSVIAACFQAYLGGRSLSIAALACTGRYLTDTVTALKLFPRTLLNELDLQTTGFELDHEITSKLLARGCRIVEVPIDTFRGAVRREKRSALKTGSGGCGRSGDIVGDEGDPRAKEPAVAAPPNFSRNETIGARDRERDKPFTLPGWNGYAFGHAVYRLEGLRPARRRERDHVRPRPTVNSEQNAGIFFLRLQHCHACGRSPLHPEAGPLWVRGTIVKKYSNGRKHGSREDCPGRKSLARFDHIARADAQFRDRSLDSSRRAEAHELGIEREVELALGVLAPAQRQRPGFHWPPFSAHLESHRRIWKGSGRIGPLEIENILAGGQSKPRVQDDPDRLALGPLIQTCRQPEQWRQFCRADSRKRVVANRDWARDRISVSNMGNSERPSTSKRVVASGTTAALMVTTAMDTTTVTRAAASAARPSDAACRRASIHATAAKASSQSKTRMVDARVTPASGWALLATIARPATSREAVRRAITVLHGRERRQQHDCERDGGADKQ